MCADNAFFQSTHPVALITGASGGLGREFSKLLAQKGYRLILMGRSQAKLEALAHELETPTQIFVSDFSEPEAIAPFKNWQKANEIHVDVLINNAGWGKVDAIENSTAYELSSMIDVNIRATTLMTQVVLDDMLKSRSGKILNVASIASFMPCPGFAVYAASKAYVLSFSEALREEVKDCGITITALCPGPIDTEFWQHAGIDSTKPFKAFLSSPAIVAQVGLDALFCGKTVCVPGAFNKVLTVLSQVAPRCLVRAISFRVINWANRKNTKNLHFSKH